MVQNDVRHLISKPITSEGKSIILLAIDTWTFTLLTGEKLLPSSVAIWKKLLFKDLVLPASNPGG